MSRTIRSGHRAVHFQSPNPGNFHCLTFVLVSHFSQIFLLAGKEKKSNAKVTNQNINDKKVSFRPAISVTELFNPSGWGHLNPSSYCDVGRLFYGVFKLWSKLLRKKLKK